MRKFRFIGNSTDYGSTKGLFYGHIYDFNYRPFSSLMVTIEDIFTENDGLQSRVDWEEVTVYKPLHKDTDLGSISTRLLASMLMNDQMCELMSKIGGDDSIEKSLSNLCKAAIISAKELIKQLNEE